MYDLKESFQVEKRQLEEHIGMPEKEHFCSEVGRFSTGSTPDNTPDSALVSEKDKGEAHKEGESNHTVTTTGTYTVTRPRSKGES